jgi:hypothetical protein
MPVKRLEEEQGVLIQLLSGSGPLLNRAALQERSIILDSLLEREDRAFSKEQGPWGYFTFDGEHVLRLELVDEEYAELLLSYLPLKYLAQDQERRKEILQFELLRRDKVGPVGVSYESK